MYHPLIAKIQQLQLYGLPHANANQSALQTMISIVIGIVAALCLLMITISGFRYIVSGGDPQATGKAKNGIIYALVGLIVTILAQAIVIFVFNKVS